MCAQIATARAAVPLLGLAIAALLLLQPAQVGATNAPAYFAPPGSEDVVVQVFRADGDPLSVATTMRLSTALGITAGAVTEPKHHQAHFHGIPLGFVRLEIVADGFATADLKLLLEHPGRELHLAVYLRKETEGRPGGDGGLPEISATASSHFAKALEFLPRGEWEKSRQQLRKLRPDEMGDSNLQYLLGLLDYRSSNTGTALFHFSQAVYLNPESLHAGGALAGLLYRTGIYSDAYEEFSRLARRHPQDWELSWQAASAAFLSAQYTRARESAQAAFARGGAAAVRAEYLLSFTDAMLGKWQEARETAAAVAKYATDPALAVAARELIAAAGPVDATAESSRPALRPERADAGVFPGSDFDPRVPSRLWAPPDVDGALPTKVQGPSCDAAEVLILAGRRVVARFDQLGEVAAKDHIEQARLSITGRVTALGQFTADYMPEVLLETNGAYAVDEFLAGVIPDPSPGSAVAQGRASLAQIFSPAMQPDFAFECEGLTLWNGRPAWSVHFTQRKEQPSRLRAYGYSGRSYPAYIRGRAYVDQALGELLHMETDLEDPIPELGLEEEHLMVDYMPVKFQSADEPYYLPSEAELYVNARGHFYRITERFKEYVRFAVTVHQETKHPSGQE